MGVDPEENELLTGEGATKKERSRERNNNTVIMGGESRARGFGLTMRGRKKGVVGPGEEEDGLVHLNGPAEKKRCLLQEKGGQLTSSKVLGNCEQEPRKERQGSRPGETDRASRESSARVAEKMKRRGSTK